MRISNGRTTIFLTNYLQGVSVTADGSIAVSASMDKTLKVWDLKNGAEIHTLSGHTAVVRGVSVTWKVCGFCVQ